MILGGEDRERKEFGKIHEAGERLIVFSIFRILLDVLEEGRVNNKLVHFHIKLFSAFTSILSSDCPLRRRNKDRNVIWFPLLPWRTLLSVTANYRNLFSPWRLYKVPSLVAIPLRCVEIDRGHSVD